MNVVMKVEVLVTAMMTTVHVVMTMTMNMNIITIIIIAHAVTIMIITDIAMDVTVAKMVQKLT